MAYRDEIRTLWNWLPAFRAVAETEHLPTAAKRVHLTAAALSRTVRLLEQELGMELFHRRGRGLVLNEQGQAMLQAVRLAMRTVHEARRSLDGRTDHGPVRIAAGGVSRVVLLDVLTDLVAAHPSSEPWILTPDPSTVVDALLTGTLDLVLGSFLRRADGLATEVLGTATSAVYCGPSHPLFHHESVTLDEVVAHPFVVPPADGDGTHVDGWPAELPRRTTVVVDRQQTGVEVCRELPLLAVLPDALARRNGGLRALPLGPFLPSQPVVALFRERIPGNEGPDPVATAVRLVRARLSAGQAADGDPTREPQEVPPCGTRTR
jgi:DNA-binding transcriptional LysR family regulator